MALFKRRRKAYGGIVGPLRSELLGGISHYGLRAVCPQGHHYGAEGKPQWQAAYEYREKHNTLMTRIGIELGLITVMYNPAQRRDMLMHVPPGYWERQATLGLK